MDVRVVYSSCDTVSGPVLNSYLKRPPKKPRRKISGSVYVHDEKLAGVREERTNERGEFLLVALVRNCGHRSNHHRRPGAEYLVCTHQIVDGN